MKTVKEWISELSRFHPDAYVIISDGPDDELEVLSVYPCNPNDYFDTKVIVGDKGVACAIDVG